MNFSEKISKLADLMVESKKTVILTGAGISTESGIPDFRSPEGLWRKVDPMYVFSSETFIYRPEVFYETGMPLLGEIQAAEPNDAHRVIAGLETAGLVRSVITQNVDGLHQRAGSKMVYELHGHFRSASCINCGSSIAWRKLEEMVQSGEIPPRHSECGGVFKPDAVFFGDQLPHDFHQCCREVSESDLLVVVGSSLEVCPVNYLPGLCKKLAIVNLGGTMADHLATLKVEASAGDAFTMLAGVLKARGK
ncbi:MAG: SIR2 family NAD-dependent protein deacylase [Desulfocucumaceae bacterium]